MGCHFLLLGIFLAQGLNLGFLHFSLIFYRLSHQGKAEESRLYLRTRKLHTEVGCSNVLFGKIPPVWGD